MISMEKRELITRARADGMKIAEIARVYRVCESTVYKLFQLVRETGSIKPRPHAYGRKPALDEAQMRRLGALIEERRDITLEEIKEKMELSISLSALSRIIRNKLGYRYKKRQYTRKSRIDRTLSQGERLGEKLNLG